MTDYLFHIGSEPDIRAFEPRHCRNPITGIEEALVWAVDSAHLHYYILPRDCPRVTFYAKIDTLPGDIARLMCGTVARYVFAVETKRFDKIRGHTVYVYVFDSEGFELIDGTAGYHVSRQQVTPTSVRKITNILAELLKHDIELRVMPSLWELREEVIRSTIQYSIIPMKDATPPPKGHNGFHPLPE